MQWCGACTACRSGLFDQCTDLEEIGITIQGAFSEYVAVRAKHCWSLNAVAEAYGDEEKALEAGAMVEPARGLQWHLYLCRWIPAGQQRASGRVRPGGIDGHCFGASRRGRQGAGDGPSPRRQEMAKSMGADFVFIRLPPRRVGAT